MLLKTDMKKLAKIYKELVVNDLELEEYAGLLEEKAEGYYEKDNDEKAEAYQEVAESLSELVEAYQRFQSSLYDYEIIEE